MHSERKRANKTKKQKEAKDFVKAEMEIGLSNVNRNSVTCPMNRSQSSYSLPLRPQSTHGFPVRSPTAHCLPHKSVLKNSYSRQVRRNFRGLQGWLYHIPYLRYNDVVISVKETFGALALKTWSRGSEHCTNCSISMSFVCSMLLNIWLICRPFGLVCIPIITYWILKNVFMSVSQAHILPALLFLAGFRDCLQFNSPLEFFIYLLFIQPSFHQFVPSCISS